MYPSTPEFGSFNLPSSQVHVESLGELLDRLNMSKQPSTSRNVSSDIAAVEPPVSIPIMFSGTPESYLHGTPSVPAGYQSLAGVHSRVASAPWSAPVYSSGVPSGFSFVETQQFDPTYQYQFVQTSFQRPIYTLNTGLPPYESSMPIHYFLLGNNHMRVSNNIQVKLELHLVVGYQYY